MSAVQCPDWCRTGSDDYSCDGSHMVTDWETHHIASGSSQPVVDESGAHFPAVHVGLNSEPSSGRGTFLHLHVDGVEGSNGLSLDFPLDEAFSLATSILDTYAKAIQEFDRPARPDGHEILPSILEIIDHNLTKGALQGVEAEIERLKGQLQQMDVAVEPDRYNRLFERLIALENRRRTLDVATEGASNS